MAEHVMQGRALVAGVAEGSALVLSEPLSLWGGLNPDTGEIIDRHHPQSGQNVRGRALVMPAGRGSSSASSILLEALRQGNAPCAIIVREVDGILALGAVVAQTLYDVSMPVVVLTADDYARLGDGMRVRVATDGGVIIVSSNAT
jgi:predicted aconitase with swiveling domain